MITKRSLTIIVFGVTNCTFSLIFLALHAPYFLLILFGWSPNRKFYDFFDWFNTAVIGKVFTITVVLSSLLLFWTSIALIKNKSYSIRLTRIALLILIACFSLAIPLSIISSFLYKQEVVAFMDPVFICVIFFLIYAVFQIKYLNSN